MLFFFAIFAITFSFFSTVPLIEREDIEVAQHEVVKKEERLQVINIKQIYENDLFGTYKKEVPPIKPVIAPSPLPEPPKPQIIPTPEQQVPKFLEPLNITLKGIVVVSTGDRKNRVIISDNKTDQESMYKIGDMVFDAQLIRIFRNKIILLRANGQQEVFYLREQDAKLDPAYSSIEEWNKVVQEIAANSYRINIQEFLARVANLAQLFSFLSCSTAYKDGQSIGIQIGAIEQKSLGAFLGLRKGDVVMSINDTPATTTSNRMAIYKELIELGDGKSFTIKIQRQKKELQLSYTLYKAALSQDAVAMQEKKKDVLPSQMSEEQKELKLRDKYELAPTIDEIRKRERQHMLEKGRGPQSEMS